MLIPSTTRNALILAFTSGALAACGGHPPAPQADGPIEPIPAQLRAHAYRCDGGQDIVVERQGRDAVFLFLPARSLRLERVADRDGHVYRGEEGVTLRRQGARATLTTADGHRHRCHEDRERSVIEDAKLRGVDYWASGFDAGWTLEIGPKRTVVATGDERYYFPTPAATDDPAVGDTHYRTGTQRHELEVTIREAACEAHAGHGAFPTRVRLVLDGEALEGCGLALH